MFYSTESTTYLETLGAYAMCIRQVVTLLGYDKYYISEVSKNTLPMRLYLVPFPADDLRLAEETAKRMITKEIIDRQLLGQSYSAPYMDIKGGYNSKEVVTFEMQDRLVIR